MATISKTVFKMLRFDADPAMCSMRVDSTAQAFRKMMNYEADVVDRYGI